MFLSAREAMYHVRASAAQHVGISSNGAVSEPEGARVLRLAQVLHFVGPRKKVLRLVHKAFMAGGAEGAYRMLSLLPHTEAELSALDMAAAEAALLPSISSAAAAA
jgi:hypothetical protein